MLHSAFGFQRMRALADAIEERGWQTITYRDVLAYMQAGECPPENTVIVSIDDLGTNWLRVDFIPMVETFIERDMVLVLGAVVEGPQDPEVWERFKQWQEAGMEIASHSLSHYELPALTDAALEEQMAGSYEVICENLGACPITFILTFGKGADDPRVVEAARDYTFLIGIQGGRSFGTALPYVLGRIPPNNDDQTITLNILAAYFGAP